MKAINQAKKVEEALGKAVLTGEALKNSLEAESLRGDQVRRHLHLRIIDEVNEKLSVLGGNEMKERKRSVSRQLCIILPLISQSLTDAFFKFCLSCHVSLSAPRLRALLRTSRESLLLRHLRWMLNAGFFKRLEQGVGKGSTCVFPDIYA